MDEEQLYVVKQEVKRDFKAKRIRFVGMFESRVSQLCYYIFKYKRGWFEEWRFAISAGYKKDWFNSTGLVYPKYCRWIDKVATKSDCIDLVEKEELEVLKEWEEMKKHGLI